MKKYVEYPKYVENPKYIVHSNSSVISSGHGYLRREHIQNLLEDSMRKPVTMVVAGSGYGKTRTVYAFLQEYDAKTIWQQFTALDNIGTRLWENFIHIISHINQQLASELETIGFPETISKFDRFLSSISKAMISGQKYVFAYDDFHLLHNKKVLRFLDKLINTNIQNFNFILISRSEPEINTAGLLSKGLLSILREGDLRFSKSEMVSYFEMRNIRISRRFMSRIYSNTDGWIMAIRLVELFIKKGVSHEEYALTAMKQNIYKLMESDVFSLISKSLQKFLLKLSLFDSLPLELVSLLSANKEQPTLLISKINSFIHYDSFSNMYRIHHLFLEFLRQKQDLLTCKEKTECYRKAADWYASNGYRIDAIAHYGKIKEYGEINNIALLIPFVSQEEATLVIDIMSNAEKEYKQDPSLGLLRARALWFFGKRDESIEEMRAIINGLRSLPETRENRLSLSELYFHMGVSGYYLSNAQVNDYSFADFFCSAYECIPKDGSVLKHSYVQDVGSYVCRISSEKKEDMDKYIEAIKASAFYAPKLMRGYMYGMDDLAQAELAYFKGMIKDSEKLAHQALIKTREGQQLIIEIRALFLLVRTALAAGNYIKMQELFKQLDTQLKTERLPNIQTLYDIVTGWFYSVIGQGGMLANWIKSGFDHGELSIVASGVENLAKIKYCLSEKKYHDILAFWENQKNEYSLNGINAFLFGKTAMAAAKAVSLYRINEKEEAIPALQEAYRLSETNSLIMQFAELGNDMVALSKFALKSKNCTIPEEWLLNIMRKSSTYAKRLSHVASEHQRTHNAQAIPPLKLTKKETELLNDICHGMSTAEIALEHGLSQKYLNNRIQNIYFKLGAENKIDAIRIASKMDLLN